VARRGSAAVVGQDGEVKPTLVIMAAGLGSRFGGTKQLATVGPGGEALFDYSIRDGGSAGFGDVVVIVRSEIEDRVVDHLTTQRHDLPIRTVRQDDLGPPRAKPWGTLHAVLSAARELDRPFTVINADDYYGPATFDVAAAQLADSRPGLASNIAFRLGRTVPASGSVTRAVCQVDGGRLTAIVETAGCERRADGTVVAGGAVVGEDTFASMNVWCFDQSILDDFAQRWEDFLATRGHDPDAECQLPTVVGELVAEERLQVQVRSSPEAWIGITNPHDLDTARRLLARR
jgi:NDP-sugar pyrophosphorylase family protein